jgi:hypothetical protein
MLQSFTALSIAFNPARNVNHNYNLNHTVLACTNAPTASLFVCYWVFTQPDTQPCLYLTLCWPFVRCRNTSSLRLHACSRHLPINLLLDQLHYIVSLRCIAINRS